MAAISARSGLHAAVAGPYETFAQSPVPHDGKHSCHAHATRPSSTDDKERVDSCLTTSRPMEQSVDRDRFGVSHGSTLAWRGANSRLCNLPGGDLGGALRPPLRPPSDWRAGPLMSS